MNTKQINISSLVSDIFRNGTRDSINDNPEILGFIIGAIDNGFSVKLNGYMPIAKKGKVEIILRFNMDDNNLNMVIFKGKDKLSEFEYGYGAFMWVDVDAEKGRFFHNDKLICTFN